MITALFLFVSAAITFLQPLRYSATSRLLVVQNYGISTDAYNVSRSNQFLSNLLAQVVYSDSFYDQVMASGYNLSKNIFFSDVNKRKKQWQNSVYTRAIADTGMIVLKTYHQDKRTADLLNQAVAYTLMTKNSQYHGLGDNVKVKIIDNSTLSDWPVKPNVILNLLLGLIAGLAAGLYFVYLFSGQSLAESDYEAVTLEASPIKTRARGSAILARVVLENSPVAPEAEHAAEQSVELDIEEAGEEDEFETYFQGNIDNVLKR